MCYAWHTHIPEVRVWIIELLLWCFVRHPPTPDRDGKKAIPLHRTAMMAIWLEREKKKVQPLYYCTQGCLCTEYKPLLRAQKAATVI